MLLLETSFFINSSIYIIYDKPFYAFYHGQHYSCILSKTTLSMLFTKAKSFIVHVIYDKQPLIRYLQQISPLMLFTINIISFQRL